MTINVPGIQHLVIDDILIKNGIASEAIQGKLKYTTMQKEFTYTLNTENLSKFKAWGKPPEATDVNKIDSSMNSVFKRMVDEVKKNAGIISKLFERMNDDSSTVPHAYDIESKFRVKLWVYKGGYVYYFSSKKPRDYGI